MKKIFKVLLVVTLLLVQFVSMIVVNAISGTNDDSGVITITNPVVEKTYTIYQVLKLESYDTDKNAYTYKVSKGWEAFVDEATSYLEVDSQGYVTWVDGADVVQFAEDALVYAEENELNNQGSVVVEDGQESIEFTGLNLGYYLVDSSVGALCSLTTTVPTVEVLEKNAEPTVEKEVKEDSVLAPTDPWGESNTVDVGQVVEFKTTITVQAGAENYKLHDILSNGLTLNEESIKVYLGEVSDQNIVLNENYSVTMKANDQGVVYGFEVSFDDLYVYGLESPAKLIITYDAVLNENAVVGDVGNENDTWLEYGDNHTTEHDKTTTYTFRFDVVKTDEDKNILLGATFRLYDAATGGSEVKLVKVSDGIYRIDLDDATGDLIETVNGQVEITGLDAGSYWLEEIDAPDGYNKLASRVEVELSSNNDVVVDLENNKYTSGGVQVINKTGALLPGTGGLGTVLFIIIGSLLVTLFGVLLVTKLRLAKEI